MADIIRSNLLDVFEDEDAHEVEVYLDRVPWGTDVVQEALNHLARDDANANLDFDLIRWEACPHICDNRHASIVFTYKECE